MSFPGKSCPNRPTKEVEPNFWKFCLDCFDDWETMPPDLQNKFAVSVLSKHIKSGDTTYLKETPRSNRLKKTLAITEEHVEEKYKSDFIDHAVSTYLEESKNKLTLLLPPPTTDPNTDDRIPTDLARTLLEESKNKLTLLLPPPTTDPPTDDRIPIDLARTLFKAKPNNNSTNTTDPAPHQQFVQREHINNAMALDYFGPSFLVERTEKVKQVRRDENIPLGSIVRTLKCHNLMCKSKVVVWSSASELDSSPAYTRIYWEHQHHAHRPPNWMDWYLYKVQCSNCPNKESWDNTRYPKQPGLPHFLLLAVQRIVKTSPSVNISMVATTVGQQYNSHPLLQDARIREMIHRQLCNFARRTRKKVSPSLSSIKRVSYMGDITEYISKFRIKYDRLADIAWTPYLRSGYAWTNSMALVLKKAGVLHSNSLYDKLPERDLIVLDSDDVVCHDRWKQLFDAPDSLHKTGPDPRGRIIVFSSIALLSNAVWAYHRKFDVCGHCDGTHGLTSTDFKLITLGFTSFCGRTEGRKFHPLVYGFGEGEREIVVLHTFLNLNIALRKLFGIEQMSFLRGIVSDASPALVNAIKVCYPDSQPLQCYPHIIRKFMVDDRSGNGAYLRKLKKQKKDWVNSEAQVAIRMCSFSKTQKQRNKLWELTQGVWEAAGEKEMADTFAETYIKDDRYNKWYYTASRMHGCVPCNNPMERHNLSIKGSVNFSGMVTLGCSMHTALTQEFVKLVYHCSTNLVDPMNDMPVLDFQSMWRKELFTTFLDLMKPDIDIVAYGSGWLMNDNGYLGITIQAQDIRDMEDSLNGVIKQHATLQETRQRMFQNTTRFHHVVKSVWTTGNGNEVECCICDCRHFYFHRYCWQSAYLQHRERIMTAFKSVKDNKKYSKRKLSSSALQRQVFNQARLRIAKATADAKALANESGNCRCKSDSK